MTNPSDRPVKLTESSDRVDPGGPSSATGGTGWFGSLMLVLTPFAIFAALMALDGLLR